MISVQHMRRNAKRRLPRMVFDFLDGGAEDEVTIARNRRQFDAWALRPRVLVDVSRRSQRVRVCGRVLDSPILLAPTGLPRLAHPDGELAVVRAAERMGALFVVSSASSYTVERIANESASPLWFQLYPWRDRSFMSDLVDRAAAAGYEGLCVTVDVPVAGGRERDIRNGFTVPLRPRPSALSDLARHPSWLARTLFGPPITLANLTESFHSKDVQQLANYMDTLRNPAHSWDDLVWLREKWKGSLLIKGVMTGEDARQAADVGVDGVIVSNHGGRQLDGAAGSVEVLEEIVDTVGAEVDVVLDGGIRRGSDVVKAIALGAAACMIGRPYWYALACGGQAGVEKVIEILKHEIDRTLALLGCADITQLDRSYVTRAGL